MFTSQEPPAGWVTEHSSGLSPKKTLINPSCVLVDAVKRGTETKQPRRKEVAAFRVEGFADPKDLVAFSQGKGK